jgi:hypothetical protein
MRYPRWRHVAASAQSDVRYTPTIDADTGEESAVIQVGRRVWEQRGTTEGNDYCPQVTGYVMSELRARLWRLIDACPPQSVLYVDTDSLLVTDAHLATMTDLQETALGRGLRLKRAWRGMAIYGPRQVVTEEAVKIAGLPRKARRVTRHDYEGEVTETLLGAIGGRRLDVVQLTPRQWRIEGVDPRRAGPSVGWTSPFALGDPTLADSDPPVRHQSRQ